MRLRTLLPTLGLAWLVAAIFLVATPPVLGAARFLAKLAFVGLPLLAAALVLGLRVLGPARVRALLATAALAAASVAAALLVSEALVRLAFRQVTTTPDNSSYFARRWTERHPPRLNRFGFRERELPERPPSDVYRIAVIGDSFTYGQGVAEEDRFTNVLEELLGSRGGSRYEVLNFGRPGAETDEHIRILREFVLPAQPHFVLLQWFVNDVEVRGHAGRPAPWRLLPSDYLGGWLHRHSALYYVVRQAWVRLQTATGLVESYEAWLARTYRDPAAEASRAAARALEGFVELAESHGVPMAIVLFPMLAEVGGRPEAYPLGFLMDRVLAFCRERDIFCIDLRPVFAPIEPARRLWANPLDPHPGPLAHRLAAEALLRQLGKRWRPAATR